MNKRLMLSGLLALIAGVSLSADAPAVEIVKEAATGLKVTGKVGESFSYSKNPAFLNSNLPDQYGSFKTTIDVNADAGWGEDQYGHEAVSTHIGLRHKGYWGDASSSVRSEKSNVKVGNATTAGHNHESSRPLVWIKQAWMTVSVDALSGLHNKGTHKITAGYVPFQFGRGIALGDGYGTSKDFLSIYNREHDYSAPGILYSGNIYDGKVGYDFYYAKFEESSASLKQTLKKSKTHRLDVSATRSWAGTGNDDELFGIQLRLNPAQGGKLGTAHINPYAFLNLSRDKALEMVADSKSDLATIGCSFEYDRGNFECGGEVAFNRGKEYLYSIDRNILKLRSTDAGLHEEYFSHILDQNSVGQVAATAALKTELGANNHRSETGTFTDGAGVTYTNAADRIRPAHSNNYRGWMAVWDMAYHLQNPDMKIAVAGGWVSGDANPHATEKGKDYKGFVGLNESYSGKRVKSLFILDSRSVKRPLTHDGTAIKFEGEDGSFSDLRFVGLGFDYRPGKFKASNGRIATNTLLFWKDHLSPRIDLDGAGSPTASQTEKAGRFMGTEWNCSISFEPLEHFEFKLAGAVFLPGTYYKDIRGALLGGDFLSTLDNSDVAQIADQTVYRLGNDTAYFVKAGVSYSF